MKKQTVQIHLLRSEFSFSVMCVKRTSVTDRSCAAADSLRQQAVCDLYGVQAKNAYNEMKKQTVQIHLLRSEFSFSVMCVKRTSVTDRSCAAADSLRQQAVCDLYGVQAKNAYNEMKKQTVQIHLLRSEFSFYVWSHTKISYTRGEQSCRFMTNWLQEV